MIAVSYFIWFMGVLAYVVVNNDKSKCFANESVFLFFLILTISLLFLFHSGWVENWLAFIFKSIAQQTHFITIYKTIENCLLGGSFSGMVPFLSNYHIEIKPYKTVSKWLSETSYTLYLVHFPILAFFFFTYKLPERVQPSIESYAMFIIYLSLTLLFARCCWYFFERNTDKVRNVILKFTKGK